jgi:hypothetical protein
MNLEQERERLRRWYGEIELRLQQPDLTLEERARLERSRESFAEAERALDDFVQGVLEGVERFELPALLEALRTEDKLDDRLSDYFRTETEPGEEGA